MFAALRHARELSGATPGTLETFLAIRGARTLAVRLERAQHNAMILAESLRAHPNVLIARYPGLASHPTHDAIAAAMRSTFASAAILITLAFGIGVRRPRARRSGRAAKA